MNIRTSPRARGTRNQRGIIGLIAAVVAILVVIVLAVALNGGPDARKQSQLVGSGARSALVQTLSSIETGWLGVRNAGVPALGVTWDPSGAYDGSHIFGESGGSKPVTPAASFFNPTAFVATSTDYSRFNVGIVNFVGDPWFTVIVPDVTDGICPANAVLVGSSADTGTAMLANSAYDGTGPLGAPSNIATGGGPAKAGCVQDSAGAMVFVFPLERYVP